MKKIFSFLFFVITACHLSAQSEDSLFCNDPLINPQTLIWVVDYSYVLQEDTPYDIEICEIKKLKHAYFLCGRITFRDTVFVLGRFWDKKLNQDSVVGVRILIPKDSQTKWGERIKTGKTYSMCLNRYYPYPLSHAFDYYINYNFMFGNDVVGLQATGFNYIFTCSCFKGMKDGLNCIEQKQHLYNIPKDTILSDFVSKVMSAIIYDDTFLLLSYIDAEFLKNTYKKYVEYSTVCNYKHYHRLPPKRIKREHFLYRKYSTSTDYFSMVREHMINWYEYNPSDVKYDITEYRVMYEKDNLITVRIMWNSTFCKEGLVTYMLVRKDSDGYKMVGLCTYSR